MANAQNSTKYKPTPKEELLLEALLNPENRKKTVTKICEIAGCSRRTYYTAFEKPEFVEYYKEKCRDLVKQSVAPIVNTFVKMAKKGSYTHGKVVLEMAGMYTEKKELDVAGKDGKPFEVNIKVVD